VDKHLIERLKDPLLHLVRNALSHGVESKAERTQAGKPPEATIALAASTAGDSVLIRVSDDGRGIDPKAVERRARALGMDVPAQMENSDLLKILCSPGFSTRTDADRASGRGVGMDVVYNTVRELGGSLTFQSELNRGTQFTLRLPLTLAIAETFIVSAAQQTCAIPQSSVSEIIQVQEDQIRIVNRVEVVPYRSGVLPVVRLSSLFHLSAPAGPSLCVLVISSERGSTGLVVEKVHGQKEVVVRAMRDPLIQVPGIAGATELGDGRPVLILDTSVLTSGPIRPHEYEKKEPNGVKHGK
jgi:two-component system chemotaxis sensor kinase CheA